MKKILLSSAVFLMTLTFMQAQVIVDGVDINNIEDLKVCQMNVLGKLFSNKVTITINYGQAVKFASRKGTEVRNRKGELQVFNSTIEALNFMENNDWEMIDVVVYQNINSGASTNSTVFFFRKKE